MSAQLREWLIADIARDAEIPFKIKGDKAAIKCPFHDDRSASAIITARNAFYCSCCTPNGGWSAKKFCTEVGQRWEHYTRGAERGPVVARRAPPRDEPTFTSAMAQSAWSNLLRRAQDFDCFELDRDAYGYLESRSILPAVDLGCLGIVGDGEPLPRELAKWWASGHRIAAALYDQQGVVTSVQARTIHAVEPKTLFPAGSRVAGTFFADERFLKLVRTHESVFDTILFAEGLTDYAAFSWRSPVPVISAPGTGMAVSAVGEWARGRRVFVALDCDPAGRKALDAVNTALREHGATRVQRIGWPRGCKDGCDVLARKGPEWLTNFLTAQLAKGAA